MGTTLCVHCDKIKGVVLCIVLIVFCLTESVKILAVIRTLWLYQGIYGYRSFDHVFPAKELAQRVLDSVASDPAKLAQIVSVLGISDAGSDSVHFDGLSDGSAG